MKDSKRSDWIYIVKSVCFDTFLQQNDFDLPSVPHPVQSVTFVFEFQGSCRVLKKLQKVHSCLTQHQQRVVGFDRGKSKTWFFDLKQGRRRPCCITSKSKIGSFVV